MCKWLNTHANEWSWKSGNAWLVFKVGSLLRSGIFTEIILNGWSFKHQPSKQPNRFGKCVKTCSSIPSGLLGDRRWTFQKRCPSLFSTCPRSKQLPTFLEHIRTAMRYQVSTWNVSVQLSPQAFPSVFSWIWDTCAIDPAFWYQLDPPNSESSLGDNCPPPSFCKISVPKGLSPRGGEQIRLRSGNHHLAMWF